MSAPDERIVHVLGTHFIMWRPLGDPTGPEGEWFCACTAKFGFSDSAIAHVAAALAAAGIGVIANAKAEAWDECVDHICYPDESGAANRRRFKRTNPHRCEPIWHAHTGCGRRVESGVVHYSCGIAVERGDYEGGVYAEHLRIAELEACR